MINLVFFFIKFTYYKQKNYDLNICVHFISTKNTKYKLFLVTKLKKLKKISKKVETNGRYKT